MQISLEAGRFGTYLVRADTGESLLIQFDWDFPGLAATFGWKPCFCGRTDGTIDCAHQKVAAMLAAARTYLDRHLGDQADDPGYFPLTVSDD